MDMARVSLMGNLVESISQFKRGELDKIARSLNSTRVPSLVRGVVKLRKLNISWASARHSDLEGRCRLLRVQLLPRGTLG